jgi:hypothetical protein
MRQYPLTRANGLKGQRAFANGQFMLFRRDAYDAVGGHAAVRRALLEDLALARLIVRLRRKVGVFFADGLFRCRMYADWAQFRRGWTRIYTEAANRKASRLSFSAARMRFIGTVLPLWTLGCGIFGALLAYDNVRGGWPLLGLWLVATFVWLGALVRIVGVAQAPVWTAPLQIVGAWLTGGLLKQAAHDLRSRRPTQWGGREYDLGAEEPHPQPVGDGDARPRARSVTTVLATNAGRSPPGWHLAGTETHYWWVGSYYSACSSLIEPTP